METQHKALWTVGLSNGENYYEEKGEYKTIPGELSPWQRLLAYIQANNLKITALSVYATDGRRFNLPSAGNNPKFHAFNEGVQPTSYLFFRRMGADVVGGTAQGEVDRYSVIEAQYEGYKLQLWVDNSTLNAWTLIKVENTTGA